MNRPEVNRLKPGIYRLYWKSGGSELAAVGFTSDGGRWMAPIRWHTQPHNIHLWHAVQRAEPIPIPTPQIEHLSSTYNLPATFGAPL